METRFEGLEVESSLIEKAIHDRLESKLFVTFKSGPTYIYEQFTEGDFEEFKNSESKGSHFNKKIKGSFECNKLEE